MLMSRPVSQHGNTGRESVTRRFPLLQLGYTVGLTVNRSCPEILMMRISSLSPTFPLYQFSSKTMTRYVFRHCFAFY